jgi:hypothetical protein
VPHNDYFAQPTVFSGSWGDYFILGTMALLAVLAVIFARELERHDPDVHSPRMAWLRGGMFFCAAFIISWCTGVFGTIISEPLTTPEQLSDPAWIGMTALCVALVIWGYFYWWPKGTVTHGRPSHPIASALFGAVWGLSSGQLQLSLFAIIEEFQFGRLATAVLMYFFFATFNLNFQLGWWDMRVSPPHNIRAWNAKKVLFAHNPFLIGTLAYFTLFGNAGIYVLLQAVALAASAVAMRFPPFWLPDGTDKVSRETALGI